MGLVRLRLVALSGIIVMATFASRAWAGKNDLQLLNLCPSKASILNVPECSWVQRGNGGLIAGSVVPDAQGRADFRSLMSELGVVLAPRIPSVADTGGIAGFQFSLDLGLTEISNNQRFWNGVQGVSATNPNGGPRPDPLLTTAGAFVRKGIWLPVPTMELGFGAVHLLDSHLMSWQGYMKVAIHEGFHDWPLPSFALRGAVAYMTGTDQATMTTTSLDLLVSKGFALLKTARIEPFAGWSWISIFAHSGSLDATPSCNAMRIAAAPLGSANGSYCANFSFPDQDAITRFRLLAGFRLKFSVVFFAAQYEVFFSGSSRYTSSDSAKDQSATQSALSLSAGLGF
jgi:hypothetical protein